ncbi:unnamed protein product [Closterium sp. NIES-54]
MGSQHNPDELMGDEELDASFSVDPFFAEEAVTPAVSASPPAKRVCAAGSSSSAPVAPPAASVVPPVTPVMAPVAGPSTAASAPSTSTQEANLVVSLAITGRYLRLRHNRENVGVVVAALLMPITYRSSKGPTAEIKVFQNLAPDFSTAKARGEIVLVLRNVPVGLAVRTLRSLLVSIASNGARIIGQHPSVASFKADPGTFFIGTDLEVEVWTCALCSYHCGWALDSAMEHIACASHKAVALQSAGNVTPLDEFGDVKVHIFNQNVAIAAFLAQG